MDMPKLLSRVIAASLLLTSVSAATSVGAADRGFCRGYATAAVRQVRGALENRRCPFRTEDNESRWSTNFRTHFDWCRDVSREDAEREREARTRTLEHCAH